MNKDADAEALRLVGGPFVWFVWFVVRNLSALTRRLGSFA